MIIIVLTHSASNTSQHRFDRLRGTGVSSQLRVGYTLAVHIIDPSFGGMLLLHLFALQDLRTVEWCVLVCRIKRSGFPLIVRSLIKLTSDHGASRAEVDSDTIQS